MQGPRSVYSDKLEKRTSGIEGTGLFARAAIAKGELVVAKGGHLFDRATRDRLAEALGPAEIQLAENLFLGPMSAEERAVVDQLRQRDQQVRQEEKAHAAVAGDLAGPISYVYQKRPDGRRYAVGGSVPIKARSVSGDPQEAAWLGARVSAAAQAATNPSGADLAAARLGYGLQAQGERQALARGSALNLNA